MLLRFTLQKLEAQLRDVAYGTRQYRVNAGEGDMEEEADDDIEIMDTDTVTLERGQNLFEIHIKKVSLTESNPPNPFLLTMICLN